MNRTWGSGSQGRGTRAHPPQKHRSSHLPGLDVHVPSTQPHKQVGATEGTQQQGAYVHHLDACHDIHTRWPWGRGFRVPCCCDPPPYLPGGDPSDTSCIRATVPASPPPTNKGCRTEGTGTGGRRDRGTSSPRSPPPPWTLNVGTSGHVRHQLPHAHRGVGAGRGEHQQQQNKKRGEGFGVLSPLCVTQPPGLWLCTVEDHGTPP